MTSDELRSIGEKLYGPHWQTPLAKELHVSTRSIRHWLTRKHKINERTAKAVRSLQAGKKP